MVAAALPIQKDTPRHLLLMGKDRSLLQAVAFRLQMHHYDVSTVADGVAVRPNQFARLPDLILWVGGGHEERDRATLWLEHPQIAVHIFGAGDMALPLAELGLDELLDPTYVYAPATGEP